MPFLFLPCHGCGGALPSSLCIQSPHSSTRLVIHSTSRVALVAAVLLRRSAAWPDAPAASLVADSRLDAGASGHLEAWWSSLVAWWPSRLVVESAVGLEASSGATRPQPSAAAVPATVNVRTQEAFKLSFC